jgi:glycosyltransferase involved in cell wall biosynthesis
VIGWKPQFNDAKVASVRLRCLNPLAELRRRNFPVELFSPERFSSYSAVIFSKSYDEKSYDLAVELKQRGKRVIFDICDNHFYNPYNLVKFHYVRMRLLKMLNLADHVITSTETLAKVLSEELAFQTEPTVIGDAIEKDDFLLPRSWLRGVLGRASGERISRSKTNILWYGVHGGENAPYGMLDILNVKEILVRLGREFPIRLVVVSNSKQKYRKHIRKLPIESTYYQWGYLPFREILHRCHINIIPITLNPFTVCKSNNRLALALYEGVPTVADEIPSYRDLASFCVLNDWERGLRLYLSDGAIGRNHVKRAKAHIENHYTIERIADQWAVQLCRFLR